MTYYYGPPYPHSYLSFRRSTDRGSAPEKSSLLRPRRSGDGRPAMRRTKESEDKRNEVIHFLFFSSHLSRQRPFSRLLSPPNKQKSKIRPISMFNGSFPLLSKFLSKSATKRLPLTTKRAGKGYYKGVTGMTKQGRHTSKGKYILDKNKMLEIVPPNLEGFKLRPYVAPSVPRMPPREFAPPS